MNYDDLIEELKIADSYIQRLPTDNCSSISEDSIPELVKIVFDKQNVSHFISEAIKFCEKSKQSGLDFSLALESLIPMVGYIIYKPVGNGITHLCNIKVALACQLSVGEDTDVKLTDVSSAFIKLRSIK